jgi:hypothetical protein
MGASEERYGGYVLRLGDNDAGLRYGSFVRPNAPVDMLPIRGGHGFVAQLQQDLVTLGFLEPNEVTLGTFDEIIKWAVREFQIVSSAPGKGAAKLLDQTYTGPLSASKLTPHTLDGDEIYSKKESISGVVGTDTTTAIAAWIKGFLRCPIVFQSYDVIRHKNPPKPKTFNLIEEGFWRASRMLASGPSGKAPQVFACDFTGDYDSLPAADDGSIPKAPAGARCFPVGRRNVFGKKPAQTVGPYSVADNTLLVSGRGLAAVSPAALIGKQWDDQSLSSSEKSTYRVIRAVAQLECGGLFDSLNAYDDLRVSAGLFHPGAFTKVKKPAGQVTKAELGAFLAYLKSEATSTFDDLFENRGVSVTENWGDATIYNSIQAKYEAHISLQGADGKFTSVTLGNDADYLRNWPWFYRFEMAFRSVDKLRTLWWAYGRQRVADILAAPWPSPAPGGGNGVTIGAVFRSEASIAALLRWHVLLPGHIVSGGKAGPKVLKIFDRSGITPLLMLTKYGLQEEQKLFSAICSAAASYGSKELQHGLNVIQAGTRGQPPSDAIDPGDAPATLGVDRTFQFFSNGIPYPRAVFA